ncbi:GGDEF domain-containing protein [Bradyrhizobium sp.]|uniref:GGDEF domain-containing protein n=1 Tax=Bradyrhizobium sp. TaxID=376 RepID=UPI004037AB27
MAFLDSGSNGEHERERSIALAEFVRSTLREVGLAPTPRNYEIWYAYGLKNNRALNQDIEAMLASGGAPAESELERLHEAHFGAARMLGKMQAIGCGLNTKLGDVVGFMTATLGSASAYGQRLDTASQDIAATDDPAAVVATVQALVAATIEMRQDSQRLKLQLDGAMQEIAELQQGLHTIRMESRADSLTQLGNRKHFDEALSEAVRNAADRGEPLSLLMIDIDHFKSFNDTYGHATGDQVLRLVAASLKQGIRAADVAARFGGEEFGIVLPNAPLQQAVAVADQLRRSIMARELKKKSTGEVIGRITVSIGVATLLPYDSKESLLERADGYLYAAKRAGRNRVVGAAQLQDMSARVA